MGHSKGHCDDCQVTWAVWLIYVLVVNVYWDVAMMKLVWNEGVEVDGVYAECVREDDYVRVLYC